jgi:iron complex outermembrane recepter protein
MEKDDVIFQNSDREFISGAQTRHRGIEASISHSLSHVWRLSANLTYAEHQYLNNVDLQGSQTITIKNNLIDTAPKTLGSMQILWQPDDQLSSEFEWVHIASYFTNAENTQRYAGHDLLNLRITQQWSDRWSGFLWVLNLTDELYAERADFAFGEDRYFVGEPRSFYIGVEYRVD